MPYLTDFVSQACFGCHTGIQSVVFLRGPEYWKEIFSSGSTSVGIKYIFRSRVSVEAFVLTSV